jgi:hypothetical protein
MIGVVSIVYIGGFIFLSLTKLERVKLENVGGSTTIIDMNNYQRGFSHDLPTLQTT